MASRAGRLKGRGKRGKHGSPEGEGGGERHAPAKPRLVAVLRSKLRFTRFLQVPTGSHCLSPSPLSFRLLVSRLLFSRLLAALLYISLHLPKCRRAHIVFLRPPSPSGCWITYFPFLSTFPKCRRAHIVFLRSPSPSGYWIAYFPFLSTFPKYRRVHFIFLRPPPLRAIGLPHSPKQLLNLNYIERKKHYFETIYLIFVSYYCILILFSLLYYRY